MSANKTFETYLFNFLQEQGLIDKDEELLGETEEATKKAIKPRRSRMIQIYSFS